MPKKDVNQIAFAMMLQATGEAEPPTPKVDGRSAGGLARAKNQTKEGRIDLARIAATARWKKKS